ncbi:MAG: sensor histidine kinase [Actinomycetota bacterium]
MGGTRGWRGTDSVLVACLAVSVSAAVVALAAKAGLAERPPDHNIYESWQLALGAPFVAMGAYVVFRAPRHAMGWLLVAAGGTVWATPLLSATIDRGWLHPGSLARVILFAGGGGWVWSRGIFLVLVPLAYPTGRVLRGVSNPRRIAWAVAAGVVFAAGLCNALSFAAIDFQTGAPASWTEPFQRWFPTLLETLLVVALVAQVDLVARVLRMSAADRRRHALFAVAIVLLSAPGLISFARLVGWLDGFDSPEAEFVPAMLLPLALGFGVLRHGTLGFRAVVRRTAFYAGVTVLSAVLYFAVVGVFAVALQDGVGVGPVVATGLVAISLQPVRAAVQRVVDRWVFGDRDEPYRALAGLNRRLGGPDTHPLAVVAEVVRSSLKLRAVSVEWLAADGERVVGAHAGDHSSGDEAARRLPVLFEGRQVAELVVHDAEGASSPNAAELRLLNDLAGAAGAVVQAARTAEDLARSRGLIVRAREEERRRLRHDLHDGLGPTLASVAMGLDAAANRLTSDPQLSTLLHDLDQALRDAIADIRRLVAGLRPPALDELGLIPALREQALDMTARARRADGSAVTIDVSGHPGLPTMAAAVEVAAYRIAIEGMTNVLRHADASECKVRLSPAGGEDDAIEVMVEDDGRGIADDSTSGIGLESMRNRAEELGGRVRIRARPEGGTLMAAVLPLHGAPPDLARA